MFKLCARQINPSTYKEMIKNEMRCLRHPICMACVETIREWHTLTVLNACFLLMTDTTNSRLGGETFTIVQLLNPLVYHHVHFDSVICLEHTFTVLIRHYAPPFRRLDLATSMGGGLIIE